MTTNQKVENNYYNVVCPMRSAWDLNKSLPSSKLYVIDNAGHSMKEIGISKKLIEFIKNQNTNNNN